MSLSQINDYGIGDVNLTSLMETLDRQRRGYQAVSLTNYDNNNEPKIAAGSIVEVGGALFKCEADESITGWAGISVSTDAYIKLVPSGTTATAAFTTAAPTWSTSKQGWYVGNDRYIGGLYKDAGGDYTIKWLYTPEDTQNLLREGKTRPLLEKVVEIGDWNMNTVATVYIDHEIPDPNNKIRVVSALIRNDNGTDLRALDFNDENSNVYTGGITVNLLRQVDSYFDDPAYETAPGGNRGWIYIKYRA